MIENLLKGLGQEKIMQMAVKNLFTKKDTIAYVLKKKGEKMEAEELNYDPSEKIDFLHNQNLRLRDALEKSQNIIISLREENNKLEANLKHSELEYKKINSSENE